MRYFHLFFFRKVSKYPHYSDIMPAMVTEHNHGGVDGKKRVRIRTDFLEEPTFLPPKQYNTNTHKLQRPSSAHTPSTQPLLSLNLRRWRPVSARGNTAHCASQRPLSALTTGNNTVNKVPKPSSKTNQEPAESRSRRELTKSERNNKKARLMRFTYPTQMHNWVGPQHPIMLKRSVPRCLQRGNYYARLPQKQACHYAPWKSITHVSKHQFTSFSLPHPRNRKEQEALEVKAKSTPRTPHHIVQPSDGADENQPTENIMELRAAEDGNEDENASNNGSYHYVYEESDAKKAKEEAYSDDYEEEEDENEDSHSTKSKESQKYEYQEIPKSRKKTKDDGDEYYDDFDKEEQDTWNGNKEESDSNNEIDDETNSTKKDKSGSRRSSKISNHSSRGKRDSSNDSIEDEVDSSHKREKINSRRSSRISNSSIGRRDSGHDSIEDEMDSPKTKEPPGKRDSSLEGDVIDEYDDIQRETKKAPTKQRRLSGSSEAESVGDDDEGTSKKNRREPGNKGKSTKRSNSSSSDSEEERQIKTDRKSSVSSRKSSIVSQRSSASGRKSSIANRKESVSSRKSSIVSNRKDSVVSNNSYHPSDRKDPTKDSVLSRKNSVTSQKSYSSSRKGSTGKMSEISEKQKSDSEGDTAR